MTNTLSRRAVLTAAAGASFLAATGVAAARDTQMTIQRLDWAGVRLRVGDIEVFIDVSTPEPHDGEPALDLTSDAARAFALATHHHGDHLD